MKISIQGHPIRGKEVIQILESLGGKNTSNHNGKDNYAYYISSIDNCIYKTSLVFSGYKHYTLEEFEKDFPFKIGDKVITNEGCIGVIEKLIPEHISTYCVKINNVNSWCTPSSLRLYKEMKEERNVTLTLDKAKEWYNKGGELKEIALQAFTEKELNHPLPKSWEEFCRNYPVKEGECWLSIRSTIEKSTCSCERRYKNWIPSQKSAEAHLAMIQLEQLRDCWREGWEPDWNNGNTTKYAIKGWRDKSSIETTYVTHSFLSFPTYEMAKEFLECFRDLIEKAGDLI